MKLPNAEEHLMKIIWKCEMAFLKDIMEHYPEPKPAVTTVATLLKRLQERGVIAYHLFGNSRQYYPLVSKEDYFSRHVNDIVKNYFGNSALQFASFFTTNCNLSAKELEALKKIVEKEIKRREK
jgi:predicted transcriptional regulator